MFDGQNVAIAFSLAQGATLESILTSVDGQGSVTLGILARSGAVPTAGSWLYRAQLNDPLANTLLTPSGWTLAAGNYWLVAVAGAGFSGQWQSGTGHPQRQLGLFQRQHLDHGGLALHRHARCAHHRGRCGA